MACRLPQRLANRFQSATLSCDSSLSESPTATRKGDLIRCCCLVVLATTVKGRSKLQDVVTSCDYVAGWIATAFIGLAQHASRVLASSATLDQTQEDGRFQSVVVRVDPAEMQELVAGILRAMGYKTRVSPSGSDRGKDIVASRDGLGFEDPRIVVEVKHRNATMGSQEIRGFLGGRHESDKGLYVSTGGFTKDARYEAERARIPLTLMDLDDLVRVMLEHYERMDIEAQRLVPLRKIYWPA